MQTEQEKKLRKILTKFKKSRSAEVAEAERKHEAGEEVCPVLGYAPPHFCSIAPRAGVGWDSSTLYIRREYRRDSFCNLSAYYKGKAGPIHGREKTQKGFLSRHICCQQKVA